MAKTLTSGTRGYEVQQLQKQLQAAGYDVGKSGADGIFGKDTEAAVKQYQKDNNLVVDGIVGQKTFDSLKSNSVATAAAGGIVAGGQMAAGTKATSPTAQTPATQKSAAQTPAASTPSAQAPAASAPASTPTTQEPAKETKGFTYDPFTYDKEFTYDDFNYGSFSYADYEQSDTVKQANALLNQHSANKPGAYQSQWQDQIDAAFDAYNNRDPFSYDFNADALYQQYKNNYIQQGQMAMMNTMGQAAALTGGYGNSYAQTVGQQAYNQQLNQLNDVIPELYQMAYNRYDQEGTDLYNQYNMLLARENKDYARYQDSMNAWQAERDYLANQYNAERDYDYNQWLQGYNQAFNEYSSDRSLAYDAWATGRQQAFNEYTADKSLAFEEYDAGRDLAWEEYLAEQEKEQAAAQVMAGVGNYDRLGEVYGLSDEEVAAIKKANTPTKKSGGGSPTPKYDALTGDDATQLIKNLSGATDATTLGQLAGIYAGNYNPAEVDAIVNYVASVNGIDLTGGAKDTEVPLTEEQKRKAGGQNVANRVTAQLR